MSMSTIVVGFIPPDDEYKRKAAAWNACKAAGVEPPHELLMMFDDNEPDPHGMEISKRELEACGALAKWHNEYAEGYEVTVAKLPPNVKVIRFYNSW